MQDRDVEEQRAFLLRLLDARLGPDKLLDRELFVCLSRYSRHSPAPPSFGTSVWWLEQEAAQTLTGLKAPVWLPATSLCSQIS